MGFLTLNYQHLTDLVPQIEGAYTSIQLKIIILGYPNYKYFMKSNSTLRLMSISLLMVAVLVLNSCKNHKNKTVETKAEKGEEPFFKLSLAQWSLHTLIENGDLDPFDFAKEAKALGFNAVEYVDQLYIKQIDSMGFDAVIERLKQESEKHGIKNVLIMVDEAGDLADADDEKRNASVEMHKKYVDAAAYLGCHAIRVNTFGTTDPEEWKVTVKDGLEKLSKYAATKNISVLAENHGWYSSDPRMLIPVLEEINLENCGTLADFGNWCIDRKDGEDWGDCLKEYPDKYEGFQRLMTKAQAVSAKAYAFDENGNETTIDFAKMMQSVKDAGYAGYVSVEYEEDGPGERQGIETTKQLLLKSAQDLN